MPKPWVVDAAERVEEEELTDLCTITRADPNAETTNPVTGVVTPSITVIQNRVACLVRLARPERDITVGDDRQTVATHIVSLPLEVAIVQPGDQITVDDSPNVDLVAAVFDVIGSAEATHRVRRQVRCRKVTADDQR